MSLTPLPRTFYARDTHEVARELLGKVLVRTWRGAQFVARITEVECYVGEDDRASHASRGRTTRTTVMYGEAGHAYVYLIYGMHYCLNVVTDAIDFPAAILIRGVDIVSLTPSLLTSTTRRSVNGPGKLTRALHITRAQNRLDLTHIGNLYLANDGYVVSPSTIQTAPRINVAYAGDDALLPWRYYYDPHIMK